MKKKIDIDGDIFEYSEVALFHSRKLIDRKISKENLEILNGILEKTNFIYGLIDGTLLGAIREGNFIEHDEDIDIYLLSEFKTELLRLLPLLRDKGLELIRFEDNFISLMRNNEYIDIYFFESQRNWYFKRLRVFDNNYEMDAISLENPINILFLGMNIPIPSNARKLLRKTYGKNWKVPIKGFHAEPNSFQHFLKSKFQWLKRLPFITFLWNKFFK